MAAGLKVCDQFIENKVVNRHVVGGQAALFRAVKIALAHSQWILTGGPCYGLYHAFAGEHALRSTKAAKGGIGYGVGKAALRADTHRWKKIGVIHMKHGAVVYRVGQIEGTATARGQGGIHGQDAAIGIMADFPVDAKVMALAGHAHIIIAIQTALDRTGIALRRHGSERRPLAGLTLLAAKCTAHAPDLDRDCVGRFAQHLGQVLLDFAGMLG